MSWDGAAGKLEEREEIALRIVARLSPVMPQRSSGRSYQLRRRAASSVASFDAPPTAARAALSVSASYYSPLATASADHLNQAMEDAEEKKEGAVVGGEVEGRMLSLTTQ